MSKIQVNEIVNHFDNGAPDCPKGLTVTGVSTFSGNVSIGGTLTYEDVTNIDSVGIITAQSGINVGPTSGIGITISANGNITAAGTATFADTIQSGGTPSSGAAQGTLMGSFGGFNACRTTGTNSVFLGYTEGNASATVDILANGTATFKNKLTVQVNSASATDSMDIWNATSGGDNRVKIRTFANGGGDPYLFFDAGGSNMVVGGNYQGTTSNQLVMGTGNSASAVTGLRINGLGAATFDSTLRVNGRLYVRSINGFIDYNNVASTLEFYTNNTQQAEFTTTAFVPATDNAKFLGASSKRWNTVYAGNGTINTSDRNEKNTIQESDLGLSFIKKLKPVSYKWNNPNLNSKTHYGLIAQDVEETILSEGKTLDDFGCVDKPEDASMGINYNELIAPLIKAIQEQQEQIETLKSEVQALKGS